MERARTRIFELLEVRSQGLLAPALLLFLTILSPLAGAREDFGRITLKSGEAIEGVVAKDLGESYVIRMPSGLRIISKSGIAKIVTASELAAPAKPTLPEAPTPKAEAKGKASGKADLPKGANGQAKGDPQETLEGSSVVQILQDPRLESARAAGQMPVLEILISGTIDGKKLEPTDPFTQARLLFFFTKTSSPRFDVLNPKSPAPEKGAPKPLPGKAAASRSPGSEYIASLMAEAAPHVITFYGMATQTRYRCKLTFQLIRMADNKAVVWVESSKIEDGDPESREKICRKAHENAVLGLIEYLKSLKPFGGSQGGSESDGTPQRATSRT